jgi:hypothetical protein
MDVPRRSARHATAADGASSTDEDVLTKAMRRKAEMFASHAPGTSKSLKSFLSYSNSKLSSSLAAVGVHLGNNDREIQVSASALKHMEFDRLTVTPSASIKSVAAPLDDDSMYATSDGQLLSHLVGEVTEVGLDEDGIGSLIDLYASSRKSKSAKNRKSKESRKLAKSPKTLTVSR